VILYRNTSVILLSVLCILAINRTAHPNDDAQVNIDSRNLCESSSDEILVIRAVSDFDDINNISKRIICITPGDYSKAGIISITSSGSRDKPRYFKYYNPVLSESKTVSHAVKQRKNDQAVISGLKFSAAKYWIVDGLSIKSFSHKPRPLIYIPARSGTNTIKIINSLLEGGGGGAGKSTRGTPGVPI